MKVVDKGHIYRLQDLDTEAYESFSNLVFVKRVGDKYPGNEYPHSGTTVQEVLRACVDRLLYVNNQLPNEHTHLARLNIEGSIFELEARAAERQGREANFSIFEAVYGTTCNKCGHIKCQGDCHA